MTTYTLQLGREATTAPTRAQIRPLGAGASNSRGFVFEVPADQLYYWTQAWQDDERAAVAELDRGQGRIFDDPTDAIRWLMSAED